MVMDSQLEEDPIRGNRRITRIEDIQDQSPRIPYTSVLLITKKTSFEEIALERRRINLKNSKKPEMQ